MKKFDEVWKIPKILVDDCIVDTNTIESETPQVIDSVKQLIKCSPRSNEIIMDLCRVSMYRKYDMIDDIELNHFPREFKIGELESISNKHDRLEPYFFCESEHREEVFSNSNLSTNDLKVGSSILFGPEDISENLSGCCIYLSFIEVDTKTAFYIAGIPSENNGFLYKHTMG
jgi:hypothetical protein